MEASVKAEEYGTLPDGEKIHLFTLQNGIITAKISNYGGTIVELWVPDRTGKLDDIVLGCESLEAYAKGHPFYGCIAGRYANRIAKGIFSLNSKQYNLAVNNGENHLHGGIRGFDKVVWNPNYFVKSHYLSNRGHSLTTKNAVLELVYHSKDMEEGYPGNLEVKVIYTLTPKNELKIEYSAKTDKPTHVNLTNHSYFNLSGAEDILSHKLKINADYFTPVANSGMIPTGKIVPVKGTPFDFTQPFEIGARIEEKYDQLQYGIGYDHNYVLNKSDKELSLAAEVRESTTGRILEVFTTEPGVQLYSGNWLKDQQGKSGRVYQQRSGFCLETQHFPNSPNQPNFPTTLLTPEGHFLSTTIFKFSIF